VAKDFDLKITGALALAFVTAACGPTSDYDVQEFADRDTAVCVDKQGRRVDDSNCRRGYGGNGAFYPYYVNRGGPIPYYGDSVREARYRGGGGFRQTPGRSYYRAPASTTVTRSAAVSRGGFGSSARGGFSGSS
jgi:hypothetical protein